jgi:hypothetical protein
MHDQNNVFYAIALSAVVLITWQYFFARPFPGKPNAPKTSQARAVAPGIETNRPQTQALGTQQASGTQTATISDEQRFKPSSRQEALGRSQRVASIRPG